MCGTEIYLEDKSIMYNDKTQCFNVFSASHIQRQGLNYSKMDIIPARIAVDYNKLAKETIRVATKVLKLQWAEYIGKNHFYINEPGPIINSFQLGLRNLNGRAGVEPIKNYKKLLFEKTMNPIMVPLPLITAVHNSILAKRTKIVRSVHFEDISGRGDTLLFSTAAQKTIMITSEDSEFKLSLSNNGYSDAYPFMDLHISFSKYKFTIRIDKLLKKKKILNSNNLLQFYHIIPSDGEMLPKLLTDLDIIYIRTPNRVKKYERTYFKVDYKNRTEWHFLWKESVRRFNTGSHTQLHWQKESYKSTAHILYEYNDIGEYTTTGITKVDLDAYKELKYDENIDINTEYFGLEL